MRAFLNFSLKITPIYASAKSSPSQPYSQHFWCITTEERRAKQNKKLKKVTKSNCSIDSVRSSHPAELIKIVLLMLLPRSLFHPSPADADDDADADALTLLIIPADED